MCQSDIDRVLVDLWVIIDEDEIDYMEDTLADLAGKPTSKDNIFKKLKVHYLVFLGKKMQMEISTIMRVFMCSQLEIMRII